jgi:hypothetical protein
MLDPCEWHSVSSSSLGWGLKGNGPLDLVVGHKAGRILYFRLKAIITIIIILILIIIIIIIIIIVITLVIKCTDTIVIIVGDGPSRGWTP